MSSGIAASKAFIEALTARRSIYALGKNTSKFLSDKEITHLVQETIRQSPTSFNSQTSRAVSRSKERACAASCVMSCTTC